MRLFITAISTDSGKTLASAILAQCLKADYWKPVQSGTPKDADTIRDLVSYNITIHPESYFLRTPASPHAAARIDKLEIDLKKIVPPTHSGHMIIEGAGGLLVPLNDEEFIADLISKLHVPVVLVINLYLGCINHSLLTIEAMRHRNINLAGIIFNGPSNPESEKIILRNAKCPCILHISQEREINPKIVKEYAGSINQDWLLSFQGK